MTGLAATSTAVVAAFVLAAPAGADDAAQASPAVPTGAQKLGITVVHPSTTRPGEQWSEPGTGNTADIVEEGSPPADGKNPKDGPQTNATFPFRRAISTSAGWVTLRDAPANFVTALGHDAWGVDVGAQSPSSNWFYVNAAGSSSTPVGQPPRCLWMESNSLVVPNNTTATVNCGASAYSTWLKPSDYMFSWNGNRDGTGNNCYWINESTGQRWSTQPSDPNAVRKCDGTNITLKPDGCPYGAPVYSNVQPWRGTSGVEGQLMYMMPNNATVKWRYLTKDFRYVMIRNPNAVSGVQDWGFVPAACFDFTGAYIEWPTS